MPKSRRRIFVPLSVFVVLATACGGGPERGVNVKTVATDLVYGVPPTAQPAGPANLGGQPENFVGVLFSGDVSQDTKPRARRTPVNTPREECPEAPLDKFPDPAMSTVQGEPKEGEYRWVVNGTQQSGPLGTTRLGRFTQRQIENVRASGQTAGATEFTMVERDLRIGSQTKVRTTYEVRDGDGIYLTQIERVLEGGDTATYNPTPDVEILPLPVEIGTEISGVGIDPVSFEVMRISGIVTKRHRVNACGEPVDSFLVDGTQQFVSATGETITRNYDYGVATQLGGQIVFEHIESPCSQEDDEEKCSPPGDIVFDANIGQLKPGPLR